ncbi:class I SAM-dependent methyltransferase [Kiloniella majae]|uniref:class I SAM-dependent methyltransferase n=1 Tax=Kiloniella majae TaxID=1938558 RepID=UPI000A278EDE|nr:class I SAM-dependent methyltransferase [Kiloniella majae]
MAENFTYKDYTTREQSLEKYNNYQARYADKIRESDKVILSLVDEITQRKNNTRLKVLDIGCSTGNLLLHLKQNIPEVDYFGGDLASSSLQKCKENPLLKGVDFKKIDILNIKDNNQYDVIIINAVMYLLTWEEYQQGLEQIHKALKPGGIFINFEWMHPFTHQDIVMYETTVFHPEGIRISVRPIPKVKEKLKIVGFESYEFIPFSMPFDLEEPPHDEEVVSYTKKLDTGNRLTFRGALYQPWCHMVAHKSA